MRQSLSGKRGVYTEQAWAKPQFSFNQRHLFVQGGRGGEEAQKEGDANSQDGRRPVQTVDRLYLFMDGIHKGIRMVFISAQS